MSALDTVLEAYRDNFGIKSERANEYHREACIEVAELRVVLDAAVMVVKARDAKIHKQETLEVFLDKLAAEIAKLKGAQE